MAKNRNRPQQSSKKKKEAPIGKTYRNNKKEQEAPCRYLEEKILELNGKTLIPIEQRNYFVKTYIAEEIEDTNPKNQDIITTLLRCNFTKPDAKKIVQQVRKGDIGTPPEKPANNDWKTALSEPASSPSTSPGEQKTIDVPYTEMEKTEASKTIVTPTLTLTPPREEVIRKRIRGYQEISSKLSSPDRERLARYAQNIIENPDRTALLQHSLDETIQKLVDSYQIDNPSVTPKTKGVKPSTTPKAKVTNPSVVAPQKTPEPSQEWLDKTEKALRYAFYIGLVADFKNWLKVTAIITILALVANPAMIKIAASNPLSGFISAIALLVVSTGFWKFFFDNEAEYPAENYLAFREKYNS